MSVATVVFPFVQSRPFRMVRTTQTTVEGPRAGVTLRRDEMPSPGWLLQARFALRLPRGGQTLGDWQDWIDTYGGANGFLYEAVDLVGRSTTDYNRNREVIDEAVGTGDNSETDFPLDMKYVNASSLVVYLDDVEQVSGWSLVDNNDAPKIRFTSAPGSSVVVTADYRYYIPVVLAGYEPEVNDGGAQWLIPSVSLVEVQAGAHRA